MTRKHLQAILHYDPETGAFKWRDYGSNPRRRKERADIKTSRGYRAIHVGKRLYPAHRMAFLYMLGTVPEIVDHINRNGEDNRWVNLRPSNKQLNAANMIRRNSLGLKGVYRNRNRFSAQIHIAGKKIALGTFDTPEEAAKAYAMAAFKYFGEHARVY